MTFDILDKMVGLTVMNAVDGSIVGVSTRLVFDRRWMSFKYVLVQNEDDENHLLYLQYPDILRVNDKAILCLMDTNANYGDYIFYNDPDAFVFVGNDAMDESGRLLGRIVSAELDEDAKILTFTVRQGNATAVFDISRLVEITRNGVIIVHRTADDVFEDDNQKSMKGKIASIAPEETEPAVMPTISVDGAEAADAYEGEVIDAVDGEIAEISEGDEGGEATVPVMPTISLEGLSKPEIASEPEEAPEAEEESDKVSVLSPMIDDAEGREQRKKEQEKAAAEEPAKKSGDMAIDWGSAPQQPESTYIPPAVEDPFEPVGLKENVVATLKSIDAVSGIRYAALLVFFVVCAIFGS